MPVRIRLQRHGKKNKPFYWIVAADSRSKRDGRYLEKIGIYNPNTNPATVEVDVDQAVKWLENGAQPSDTARTLLSYRGAMMKFHLNGGVRKGAFSEDEAEKRFEAWLEEKQSKIQAKIEGLDKDKANHLAQRMEAEKAVNQKRMAELTAEPEAEVTAETENTEAPEVSAEAIAEEAPSAEAEAPEQEATPEAEATPDVEVAVEEAPAEAIASEETPAAVEESSTEETSAEEEETKE